MNIVANKYSSLNNGKYFKNKWISNIARLLYNSHSNGKIRTQVGASSS